MSENYLQTTVGKFIFRVRQGYLYTDAGSWLDADKITGVVRIGLTDFMQQSSGDIAFVDLPAPGTHIDAGGDLATIETVKVDMGVPAPFAGIIVAANASLAEAPEMINQDCYGEGWLVDVKPDAWPISDLLDASAYLAVMTRQAEEAAA